MIAWVARPKNFCSWRVLIQAAADTNMAVPLIRKRRGFQYVGCSGLATKIVSAANKTAITLKVINKK